MLSARGDGDGTLGVLDEVDKIQKTPGGGQSVER